MGRSKKKPKYDAKKIMTKFIESVAECYFEKSADQGESSIRSIAEEFDITSLKVRKLLITAGVFSTEISDEVNDLFVRGKSILEIQNITGLGRASVYSYLPYKKVIYNISEVSLNAERNRKYRVRKEAVENLKRIFAKYTVEVKDAVWSTMNLFQEYTFYTVDHHKFRYTMFDNEIIITGKDKQIEKTSVDGAIKKVIAKENILSGPEDMNVPDAEYLYPILFV